MDRESPRALPDEERRHEGGGVCGSSGCNEPRDPSVRCSTSVCGPERPVRALTFYLGTHKVGWLGDAPFRDVRLFVSRRALDARVELPRAVGAWALDSGGFTELSLHGGWTMDARAYAARVRVFATEIGGLEWAAPQDWMCEPEVVARTGLSVEKHQIRTVRNFLELRSIAPDLPIVPVLQGFTEREYLRCVDLYRVAGVELDREPRVGVGSVCRRQATAEAASIFRRLRGLGLQLHAFGAKTLGLELYGDELASADSLAWSFQARMKRIRLEGCSHPCCNNCRRWALSWRASLLERLSGDGRAPAR